MQGETGPTTEPDGEADIASAPARWEAKEPGWPFKEDTYPHDEAAHASFVGGAAGSQRVLLTRSNVF